MWGGLFVSSVSDEGAEGGTRTRSLLVHVLVYDVLHRRHGHVRGEGQVVVAVYEGQHARRTSRDDPVFDTVEVGPALAPVVLVLLQRDALVLPERDELERAGADRMRPHVGRLDVAGIDRRVAGGEQCQQRRLPPAENDGRLELAVRRDIFDVAVPGAARIPPQLLRL